MSIAGIRGRAAAAAALALALAGCAGTVPKARESAVTITKVERVRWDAPPETGLYRVRFDEALSLEIRRQATALGDGTGMDPYHAEIRALEMEVEREFKARGLCSGTAQLAYRDESGDARGVYTGLFRCRPSFNW